jgi:hypothetical protein
LYDYEKAVSTRLFRSDLCRARPAQYPQSNLISLFTETAAAVMLLPPAQWFRMRRQLQKDQNKAFPCLGFIRSSSTEIVQKMVSSQRNNTRLLEIARKLLRLTRHFIRNL